VPASERLARRWFEAVEQGSLDQLVDLVHPDIVLISMVRAGVVVEGRQEFERFVDGTLRRSLYDAAADVYRPLDDRRVVVEGRLRWTDDEQVMRDDPMTWALEFEDDLLVRFVPARTALEAETILAAPRGEIDSAGHRD
jgi:hypothetical protein